MFAQSGTIRSLALLAAVALGGTVANAASAQATQRRYPPQARNKPTESSLDKRVERLGSQLELTDVQRFDLKKLLETQQAEANRLWNDQKIDPFDRMAKLKALHEDTQKRFHAILTEDQRKKYDAMLEKAEAARKREAEEHAAAVQQQRTGQQQPSTPQPTKDSSAR